MSDYVLKVEIEPTREEALRLQSMARANGVGVKQQASSIVKNAIGDMYYPYSTDDAYSRLHKTIFGGAQL